MCSQQAHLVSTPNRFESGLKVMDFSTASKRRRLRRGVLASDPPPMRVTSRDTGQLLPTVANLGHCTVDQLCDALASPGARSRLQRRLTLLYQHRWVDKIVSGPTSKDIYSIGPGAPRGVQLLRSMSSSADPLRRIRRVGQIEHVLLINDLRCRIMRAARERRLQLVEWRDQAALARYSREVGVIPDGFFVLRRELDGRTGTAAHFVEAERSPRSPATMLRKYRRLADFFNNGLYARTFGRGSLRVLVVASALTVDAEEAWARRLSLLADKAGLAFGMFCSARRFMDVDADHLFRAEIWLRPGMAGRFALGELE